MYTIYWLPDRMSSSRHRLLVSYKPESGLYTLSNTSNSHPLEVFDYNNIAQMFRKVILQLHVEISTVKALMGGWRGRETLTLSPPCFLHNSGRCKMICKILKSFSSTMALYVFFKSHFSYFCNCCEISLVPSMIKIIICVV